MHGISLFRATAHPRCDEFDTGAFAALLGTTTPPQRSQHIPAHVVPIKRNDICMENTEIKSIG